MSDTQPIECADDTFELGPIPSAFPGASVRTLVLGMARLAETGRTATLLSAKHSTSSETVRRAYESEMWKQSSFAYGYLKAVTIMANLDDQTIEDWLKYIRGFDVPMPDPASLVPIPTGQRKGQ